MKKAVESKSTELEIIEHQDLVRIVPIRTETAISHLPFHRLSKGNAPIQIAMITKGAKGKVVTQWEVTGSPKYGEPGILAYKLDTLVINRLIDDTRPNIPVVLRLGSLREIARELEAGEGNLDKIKKALRQNATASITAKLSYLGNDGTERTFEFDATRYEVIFVGQKLPNGRKADAVYIAFHHSYYEMLKTANTRPLDYAYLKALPPTAQRLYELIAPQIYAALKNGNPRAKYLYSEFCLRASVTRYDDWERVKKQLYKVHQPHKESGYIAKLEFEETTDASGRIDWVMWYTPGRKAKAEFKRFNTKEGRELDRQRPPRPHLVTLELIQPPVIDVEIISETKNDGDDEQDSTLINRLIDAGVTESVARKLAKSHFEECERQLKALPYRERVKDKGAYLVRAIREQYAMPSGMEEAKRKEREERELEERTKEREAEQARQRAEEMYYQLFEPAFRAFQRRELLEIEQNQTEAYEIFQDWFEKNHKKSFRFIESESRREDFQASAAIEFFSQIRPELGASFTGFWEWDAEHNPDACDPIENKAQIFKAWMEREKANR